LLARLYPDIAALQTAGPAYLKAFFGHGLTATDAADYSHAIRWRNNRRNCRFFAPDFAAAIATQQNGDSAGPGYPEGFQNWGALQQAQYLEISIFLSQYLLAAQGDRVAMAHSVEGRHPFLDVRVMEFCNRLPARFKLRGLTDKFLLRQLGRKYLPEQIWRRRKRPYRAPIHRSFFSATPPEYVRELLSESAVTAAGIFNPAAIRQLVAKLESGKAVGETDDMAVVGVLSTQLVHRQFVQAFRAAAPLAASDRVKVCRIN
jgi:asparagine synthase (glutamine-hydrolysing)